MVKVDWSTDLFTRPAATAAPAQQPTQSSSDRGLGERCLDAPCGMSEALEVQISGPASKTANVTDARAAALSEVGWAALSTGPPPLPPVPAGLHQDGIAQVPSSAAVKERLNYWRFSTFHSLRMVNSL